MQKSTAHAFATPPATCFLWLGACWLASSFGPKQHTPDLFWQQVALQRSVVSCLQGKGQKGHKAPVLPGPGP